MRNSASYLGNTVMPAVMDAVQGAALDGIDVRDKPGLLVALDEYVMYPEVSRHVESMPDIEVKDFLETFIRVSRRVAQEEEGPYDPEAGDLLEGEELETIEEPSTTVPSVAEPKKSPGKQRINPATGQQMPAGLKGEIPLDYGMPEQEQYVHPDAPWPTVVRDPASSTGWMSYYIDPETGEIRDTQETYAPIAGQSPTMQVPEGFDPKQEEVAWQMYDPETGQYREYRSGDTLKHGDYRFLQYSDPKYGPMPIIQQLIGPPGFESWSRPHAIPYTPEGEPEQLIVPPDPIDIGTDLFDVGALPLYTQAPPPPERGKVKLKGPETYESFTADWPEFMQPSAPIFRGPQYPGAPPTAPPMDVAMQEALGVEEGAPALTTIRPAPEYGVEFGGLRYPKYIEPPLPPEPPEPPKPVEVEAPGVTEPKITTPEAPEAEIEYPASLTYELPTFPGVREAPTVEPPPPPEGSPFYEPPAEPSPPPPGILRMQPGAEEIYETTEAPVVEGEEPFWVEAPPEVQQYYAEPPPLPPSGPMRIQPGAEPGSPLWDQPEPAPVPVPQQEIIEPETIEPMILEVPMEEPEEPVLPPGPESGYQLQFEGSKLAEEAMEHMKRISEDINAPDSSLRPTENLEMGMGTRVETTRGKVVKNRGGGQYNIPQGSGGEITQDIFGDGTRFKVRFDDGGVAEFAAAEVIKQASVSTLLQEIEKLASHGATTSDVVFHLLRRNASRDDINAVLDNAEQLGIL